jgi:hypothetical protein
MLTETEDEARARSAFSFAAPALMSSPRVLTPMRQYRAALAHAAVATFIVEAQVNRRIS